jgi:hypothetical protein
MVPGSVYVHTAEDENRKVCRMSHTEVIGNLSRLRFEYLIGTRDGITRFNVTHDMGLFTRSEIQDSFRTAGFLVSYEESGLIGRGLYTGTKSKE